MTHTAEGIPEGCGGPGGGAQCAAGHLPRPAEHPPAVQRPGFPVGLLQHAGAPAVVHCAHWHGGGARVLAFACALQRACVAPGFPVLALDDVGGGVRAIVVPDRWRSFPRLCKRVGWWVTASCWLRWTWCSKPPTGTRTRRNRTSGCHWYGLRTPLLPVVPLVCSHNVYGGGRCLRSLSSQHLLCMNALHRLRAALRCPLKCAAARWLSVSRLVVSLCDAVCWFSPQCRYEFMEAVVRVAYSKYYKSTCTARASALSLARPAPSRKHPRPCPGPRPRLTHTPLCGPPPHRDVWPHTASMCVRVLRGAPFHLHPPFPTLVWGSLVHAFLARTLACGFRMRIFARV
jgi:hypothetical protein